MLASALDGFTDLIQKASAPLAGGIILFGGIWRLFKDVESVLNGNTKLEIAVWLLDRKKLGQKVEPWPGTFTRIFDRVFGSKHLSWKCFWRSFIATVISFSILCVAKAFSKAWDFNLNIISGNFIGLNVAAFLAGGVTPDFLSLLKSRAILGRMETTSSGSRWIVYLGMDAIVTLGCACASLMGTSFFQFLGVEAREKYLHALTEPWGVLVSMNFHEAFLNLRDLPTLGLNGIGVFFYPAFFTSVWVWLYAGSGFILKAARRFDIGFDWFNRKFDIEMKPLSSIGLVAGAIVAVIYWAAVGIMWVL